MDSFSLVESIFNQAVKLDTEEGRERLLDERCPNTDIRRQVQRLLSVDAGSSRVLDNVPGSLQTSTPFIDVFI